MTHLSVAEWGRVPVGSGGFSVGEAEALVAAARLHPLGGEDGAGIISDHRHFLRAGQMVGVLAAPGCSLEILPKVDPQGPQEDAPTVRRRLIALLDLALGLEIADGDGTMMGRGAESLLEILIRIFAERLLAETRRGLPHRYLAFEEDLPTLRGRLNVVRQFTHHAVRPDRLACHYDRLSNDIPLLQIMKASVIALRRVSRAHATQRLLDELRFVFADIRKVSLSSLPWGHVRIDRTNRRWESLFTLARLLLKRDWQTTMAHVGGSEGVSLLFAMNDLFEAAVAALLRQALSGGDIEVVAQGGLRYCLGDWRADEDCSGHLFQTRPDILLRRHDEVVAVIDTKWKSLSADALDRKKGVNQTDVYQMMAYARLYRCNRLMLLYPASPGLGSDVVRQFGIDGGRELLSLAEIDVSADLAVTRGCVARLVGGMLSLRAA